MGVIKLGAASHQRGRAMPTQKRTMPPGASGVMRRGPWRDPRTKTPLAPGAVQNWPSADDLEFMDHTRASLPSTSWADDVEENE